MNVALVSVVIPVYNVAPYLRQCLDSVAGQTLGELEVICVDDGSTDESPEILAEYARRDPRFRVLTRKNAGPGTARNAGLDAAQGEYLIFLDSDDWFEPELLEALVQRARETEADVTVCKAVEFDTATGRELPSAWMLKDAYLPGAAFAPTEISAHLFQFTYGWPWDKLYRMEFVRRTGLRYPPLRNSEDLVFVFQSLALAGRISVLDEALVHHRKNRMNSVSNSRHCNVDAPYEALCRFRSGLQGRERYEAFEQSFLNWAMEFLVWNAANLPNPAAQRDYFRKMKREYFPALGFDSHPGCFYEDRYQYLKYVFTRHAPLWLFRVVVRCYGRIKKCAEKAPWRNEGD